MCIRTRLLVVAVLSLAGLTAQQRWRGILDVAAGDGIPKDLRTDNLLANPGFEPPYTTQGATEFVVAEGWRPWFDARSGRPEFKDEPYERERPDGTIGGYSFRVHHGEAVQKFFTSSRVHDAGLYQVVAVAAGARLRLQAHAHTWSSDCDDPCVSPREPCPGSSNSHGTYLVQVGIEPEGRTPAGPGAAAPESVVWSPDVVFEAYEDWTRLEVEAQAAAGTVAVYLRGHPLWPVKHNDSYWDDARLEVVAPPMPTATGTGVPGTATSTAEPTFTGTPGGGATVTTQATTPASGTPEPGTRALIPLADRGAVAPGRGPDRHTADGRAPGPGTARVQATVPPFADVRIEYPIRAHPGQENFGLPKTCGELAFESLVIRNHGTVEVDTEDWTLSNRSGGTYVLPRLDLPPGARVRVWTRAGESTITSGSFADLYWGSGLPVWDNVSDEAILRDSAGTEVARRGYP